MRKIKIIYSLRVKTLLGVLGYSYLEEIDNIKKPGFKCWLYEVTPGFKRALDDIMEGRINYE